MVDLGVGLGCVLLDLGVELGMYLSLVGIRCGIRNVSVSMSRTEF